MFDTEITVVGTALNTPEWKKIGKTDAVVANFRVATHPRRFDKEKQEWVDATSFRVRVNCWRRLGEGVHASILSGDPVIVHGRIVTREWRNEQGETRLAYEVEADAVGHDLSRGHSTFARWKPESFGAVVEDADSESRVNGEPAETLTTLTEPSAEFGLDAFDPARSGDRDALAILREAGLDPEEDGDGEDTSDEEEETDNSGSGGGRGRRRGRTPVPA